MDSNELLVKATRRFERRDVEDILEDLYTSKDLSLSKLGSIITKGKTKATPVSSKDKDRLLNIIIPYSIIKYDKKHAMEYAGIDNEEALMTRVVRENTSVPEDIIRFKNSIYGGINGKPGVYYQGKGNKKYCIFSSSELYPNNPKFKDEGVYKHQFIVNATGKDYMEVVIQLVESFLIDGIPFNIIIRMPADMKEGYPDSIRLYCTDKNLQATIDELERMTYTFKDRLQAPDWRICASINGLYGYTQVDVKNGNKTPMDRIFEVITSVIDQSLRDYDQLKGVAQSSEYTWKTRTVKLLKMKAMDNDRYEQMLDEIMTCIGELNIDLDDIFKVPSEQGLDKDIRDMDKLLGSIDNIMEEQYKMDRNEVERKESTPNPVAGESENKLQSFEYVLAKGDEIPAPPAPPIPKTGFDEMPPYSFLANILLSARRAGSAAVATNRGPEIAGVAFNEHAKEAKKEVSYDQLNKKLQAARDAKKEEPLFVQVWAEENAKKEETNNEKPNLTFDDLDGLLTSVRVNAEAEKVNDDHDWSNITNAPTDDQPKSRLEETQAYTPITDEMVLGYEETKKKSAPVLPDDVKEVDPDEEVVSLNTGSYDAIPIEVTGFDNNEVKSIVDAPQAGQPNNMVDTAIALNEYEGMTTTREAIQDVVNSNGENVSLIDYLISEGVSKKVPFDSVVVLNDGSEITGADFIKNYIIPTVKQNTPDNIMTVDKIIYQYSTEQRAATPQKKGLFAKLFGKK